MKKLLITLTISCLTFSSILGQNFVFQWYESCDIFSFLHLDIEKKGSKYYMYIKQSNSNDSLKTKLKVEDYKRLFVLLDNYDFPIKDNVFQVDTTRTYFTTVHLADPNLVIVEGDTLRLDLLPIKGYLYDTSLEKCYARRGRWCAYTGGTSYEGKYTTPTGIKKYSVYHRRISNKDYELNMVIAELIKKYDKKNAFSYLRMEIESDKPTKYAY